jgi:translation elongation factor EF-Ts
LKLVLVLVHTVVLVLVLVHIVVLVLAHIAVLVLVQPRTWFVATAEAFSQLQSSLAEVACMTRY